MSTQRTDSVELEATITAELPAPFESLGARLPPELFENILAYVGDEERLDDGDIFNISYIGHRSAVNARRDEMRHLSACALTCVYWAQLTRQRMFEQLILDSSKDVSSLLSFFCAPQSPRISPIYDILQRLDAFYRLGNRLWFHDLAKLLARYRVSRLKHVELHIIGPARSAFIAASTQGSVPHPLFFAGPRGRQVIFPDYCKLLLYIHCIHLPNPTVLFNLLQDCLTLRPHWVNCIDLTWDEHEDPVLQATPSSVGLTYACPAECGHSYEAWECTDNILVGAMLKSIPLREFSRQRQVPHLSRLETSFLFDFMSTTWQVIPGYAFGISSNSDSDSIQANVAPRLPAGTDFSLTWHANYVGFKCIASWLPHTTPAGNDVRNITCIIIEPPRHISLSLESYTEETVLASYISAWDTILDTVRPLPHLQQIAIQCARSNTNRSRKMLIKFLARLGEAWFSLGELLGLYYRGEHQELDGFKWVQVRLDTVMDEIKQRREEIESGKAHPLDELDSEDESSNE